MNDARSLLIHEPSFSEIDARYPRHKQAYNAKALDLISKLVKQTQQESHLNIQSRVRISPKYKDAIHNHQGDYILLPYKAEYAGIDYYMFWRHEAEHAVQSQIRDNTLESTEKTMLQISQFLYPADIEDDNGNPRNEYLYNYTELKARTAEAVALKEAIQERYNAQPPDFYYAEKKAYAAALSRFCENTQGQHSLTSCIRYALQQTTNILSQPDIEHELPDQSRMRLAVFWGMQGMAKNLHAFREFEQACSELLQISQQLQYDVQHPENAPAQEEAMLQNYNNQMHQRTHDILIQEQCRVIQIIDLPNTLPENATRVHGFDAMLSFLQEFRDELPQLTICEPVDKNAADSMYIVFNTAELFHSSHEHTTILPEQYCVTSQPNPLDIIEQDVILDEIEEEEVL